MEKGLKERIKILVNRIPELLKSFSYRQGPSLYFYKRTLELRREQSIKEALSNRYYLELIYATLVAWNMDSRGAEMKYYDDFKENIVKNKDKFIKLKNKKLEKLDKNELEKTKRILEEIFNNMNLMESKSKLVSNAKAIHFILPELVMPMDRANTLQFFFGNTGTSKQKFLTIFEISHRISQEIELNQYLDDKWNLSVPKVIDNTIIAFNQDQ